MLAFVAALVVLTVMGAALLQTTTWAAHRTNDHTQRAEARHAAEAAACLAIEQLWSGFEAVLGGANPTTAAFRAYTTTEGLVDQAGIVPPARMDRRGGLGLELLPDGTPAFGATALEELWVHREDMGSAVRIHVTATTALRIGGVARDDAGVSVTRVWTIEPPRWDGLDYALLANNVNCIMCHTEVDSAQRVFNRDASRLGTFDRARVGSIESFQFRDDPDSNIAGTLYIGGTAVDGAGRPIAGWGTFPLKSAEMDAIGKLHEDAFAALTRDDLRPADPSAPLPFENLYLDYFELGAVDGTLPSTFPAPFPDDGGYDVATGARLTAGSGNRLVDDAEFDSKVEAYNGRLSGGSIGIVAPGVQLTTNGALSAILAGNTSSLDSVTRGQVVLVGTADNPLQLNGDIAIDGDVVLSGYVAGLGTLWARGNVYVRGDVQYLDGDAAGERTFGVGASGSSNALAITAGGNIVIGDLFRPGWGAPGAVTGRQGGGWNFTLEEMGIFNRNEWMKTQPELPGKAVQQVVGTSVRVEDVGEWRGTGIFEQVPVYERRQTGTRTQAVFETRVLVPATGYRPAVTERVQVGTRQVPVYSNVLIGTGPRERTMWVITGTRTVSTPILAWVTPSVLNRRYAGPDYVARYYAFDRGAVVPIFNKGGWYDAATDVWLSDERTDGWDSAKLTLANPNDPSDPILYAADGTARAAVSVLTASDDWVTDELLRDLMLSGLAERDRDEPFRIDATLYGANSIFGVIPDGDGTNGALEVNGAIIGADVGLLGPNGTRVLYDERGRDLLDIRDPGRVEITRLLAAPSPL